MKEKSLVVSTLAKFIIALVMRFTVPVKVGLALGAMLFISSIILSGSGFAGLNPIPVELVVQKCSRWTL